MFIEIAKELSQAPEERHQHISLLRSLDNFCITGYRHSAPPALEDPASSIFQRAGF